MTDISELDETAQRLRVSWRKANNYYASFASQLLEIKKQIEVGTYGPEWTFSGWLLKKAGLFELQVMTQLKVFSRVIAAEERAKIDEANIKITIQKRMAAAKKRADAQDKRQQRAIAKAHKERELAMLRSEKEAAKIRQAEEKKQQAADQRKTAQRKIDAASRKQRRTNLREKLQLGPENPDAIRILAKCATIEATNRIQLGACYAELKELVDTHQLGKDENGKYWTWGRWSAAYIQRSRTDIWKCIEEYVASCNNEQNKNVVSFPKIVA